MAYRRVSTFSDAAQAAESWLLGERTPRPEDWSVGDAREGAAWESRKETQVGRVSAAARFLHGCLLHPALQGAHSGSKILASVVAVSCALLFGTAFFALSPWHSSTALVKTFLYPRPEAREAITTLLTSHALLAPLVTATVGLRAHSPNRDYIIIVPEQYKNEDSFSNTSLKVIAKLGWKIKYVPHIPIPGDVPWHYRDTMNKLHIWNMTDYARIAMLDLDILIKGSLDEPFNILRNSNYSLAGVRDTGWAIGRGSEDIRDQINAGAMWARPNPQLFRDLVEYSRNDSNYDVRYPEQDMLSHYFWLTWLNLSAEYGLLITYKLLLKERYDQYFSSAKVVHYAGTFKPWHTCSESSSPLVCGTQIDEGVRLWRAAFVRGLQEYNLDVRDVLQGRSPAEAGYDWLDTVEA